MGHSDSTSLRDLLATEQTLRAHDQEVRVWGDMSHIEPWDEDSTHVTQANDSSVPPVPGMMPSVTSVKAKRAVFAA